MVSSTLWHFVNQNATVYFAPIYRLCTLVFAIYLKNMRQFRFDYSLKNIPIPSQDAYLRNLIEKVENVLKRMRR